MSMLLLLRARTAYCIVVLCSFISEVGSSKDQICQVTPAPHRSYATQSRDWVHSYDTVRIASLSSTLSRNHEFSRLIPHAADHEVENRASNVKRCDAAFADLAFLLPITSSSISHSVTSILQTVISPLTGSRLASFFMNSLLYIFSDDHHLRRLDF
ncbi:hypothetical protein DFS33DRAFT_1275583 [Desarmillaria ectypa]|nr:hypothetical protein DFS33DRAFT_1275583 [Desarmillaria ectypa]